MAVDWVSIIGTVGGTGVGVGASIYLFHHQINKTLTKIHETVQYLEQQMQILNDRSGVVTYEQAVEIVELALLGIEYSLRNHALSYFTGNYKNDLKDRNIANIEASMDAEGDKVINASRRQLSVFRLPGGETLKQFFDRLQPLDKGFIDETKKQGVVYFTKEERGNDSTQKLVDEYTRFVHTAINISRKEVMAELAKQYSIASKKKQDI